MKARISLFITVIISILIPVHLLSQTVDNDIYISLVDNYYSTTDVLRKERLTDSILVLARNTKDTAHIVAGLYLKADLYADKEHSLAYCDTIITLTKTKPNSFQPLSAYLVKGSYYYQNREFKKAFDSYIKANEYASRFNNTELISSTKYYIGILKSRSGNYEDAKTLFQENITFLEKKKNEGLSSFYLLNLFALSNVYNKSKALDSAQHYITIGLKESSILKNEDMIGRFTLGKGVNYFLRGESNKALEAIDIGLSKMIDESNLPNMAVGYYYRGEIYLRTGYYEKALEDFKKVDSIFTLTKDLLPELRPTFEHLVSYQEKQQNDRKEIYYIRQLLKFDSIISSNNLYLTGNISKKYDIPILLKKRDAIIGKLEKENTTSQILIGLLLGLLLLTTISIVFNVRQKRIAKKRYEILIRSLDEKNESKAIEKSQELKKEIKISDSIQEHILGELKIMEKNQIFLNAELTINKLAERINTNPKYLSQVINFHKKTSFTHYINNLRVQYAIVRLKDDRQFRKYTITAISKDIGFKKSDSFNRAFYKITGFKPTYYINQLEKTG